MAKYLEKLESVSSRNEMTVILAQLFKEASPEDARLIAYLSAGRLGPAYNSPDTGVADKMMVKALGPEAEKLFKQKGDLGLVIEQIKSQIPNPKSQENYNLSISQVYKLLLEIAGDRGTGSQERKKDLIRKLLDQLDPVSAKYAVKIILGKLRTGFSDMTVLDSLSWMLVGSKKLKSSIESMYNVRADLGEIAKLIKENEDIKKLRIEPEIGTPILMARAERAKTPQDIWERNGKCAVEYKLDGLRIQAHLKGGIVTLFSSGLENVTKMYPDVTAGLAKQIKQDCIVEGEMIAVEKNGRFLPFQETVQRKRKYDIAQMVKKVPLKIYLFDLLLLNKTNMTNRTNRERREGLEKLVEPGQAVQLMPRIEIEKEIEIEDYFKKALTAGTEGIMAKKLDGPYQAGARDFNWIKYKKSYAQSALADTIDAVVMGYDYGQGKRQQFGIGDFLIGVYEPKKDRYLTIAKVGTGLTDQEWRRMASNLKSQITSSKPSSYEVQKVMNCDVWVSPKIVVEILADEITRSPMHSSEFALRFPRLVSFRDKKPEDSTTVAEIEKIFKLQRYNPYICG